MTQLFGSSGANSPQPHDRKITIVTPSASPSSSLRHGANGTPPSSSSSHMGTKLRNFFRINPSATSLSSESSGTHLTTSGGGLRPKSRFLRNRSTSSASQLDHPDVSPTANANPYFAHQGQPALRHHNNDSPETSPSDTPELKDPATPTEKTASGKEELARKLRRVASAPNAQGMFSKGEKGEPVEEIPAIPTGMGNASTGNLLNSPAGSDPIERIRNQAFRRTYSSNSIKVRNVEVGPASFDKIKLLGKGDVGKVYLVREKKSARLYAMKGTGIVLSERGF